MRPYNQLLKTNVLNRQFDGSPFQMSFYDGICLRIYTAIGNVQRSSPLWSLWSRYSRRGTFEAAPRRPPTPHRARACVISAAIGGIPRPRPVGHGINLVSTWKRRCLPIASRVMRRCHPLPGGSGRSELGCLCQTLGLGHARPIGTGQRVLVK